MNKKIFELPANEKIGVFLEGKLIDFDEDKEELIFKSTEVSGFKFKVNEYNLLEDQKQILGVNYRVILTPEHKYDLQRIDLNE